MNDHGAKLSRKQEAAIEALLSPSYRNLTEAAQAAGVNVRTLRRWQMLPPFNEAHHRGRGQLMEQGYARLQQASSAAVALLVRISTDPQASPACRVRASKAIVELASRSLVADDVLVRIGRLEFNQNKQENSAEQTNDDTGIREDIASQDPGSAKEGDGVGKTACRKRRSKGHGAKLPRKQEMAIEALLSPVNRYLTDVARAVGVNVRTIRRWLQVKEFHDAYRAARCHLMAQSHARLQQASSVAITMLLKTMTDSAASATAHIYAAKAVLELGSQSLLVEDLHPRVEELERTQEERRQTVGKNRKVTCLWEDHRHLRADHTTEAEDVYNNEQRCG